MRQLAFRPTAFWKRLLRVSIWVFVLVLLGWVLSHVPLRDIWGSLRRLTIPQIGALSVVNTLVILIFSGRWWVLLSAMGHRLPYGSLTMHRLAGFGISYFTPGPQVGGEPAQVLLAKKRHGVPTEIGVASVGLDRLLEVIVNLSLLLAGLIVTLQGIWAGSNLRIGVFASVGLLLLLSSAYLLLLRRGRMPLAAMLKRLPRRIQDTRRYSNLRDMIRTGEGQAASLFREKSWSILVALLVSLASWVGIVFEFWLMFYFLGIILTPVQLIGILSAARIAFLLPLPGGLGTLEIGQVLIFQAFGLDPALGLSASLLIRGRDVLFGLVGLWWAGTNWNWNGKRDLMENTTVSRMASARIPTADGEFKLILYANNQDNKQHLALVMGDISANQPLLARIHSECFTGDVLGSRRCDCGGQLAKAIQLVAEDGAGVIIYLRQEGRGIGLLDKLRAYNLQDAGYDTVEANLILGHAPDERDYTVAGWILNDLEVMRVRLLTNNPEKIDALREQGIDVIARVPLQVDVHSDNAHYLLTKANRMDHALDVQSLLQNTPSNGARPKNGSRKHE
jgi:GTP cyclohydrolase II